MLFKDTFLGCFNPFIPALIFYMLHSLRSIAKLCELHNFVGGVRKGRGLIYGMVGCACFSHLTHSLPWRKYPFVTLWTRILADLSGSRKKGLRGVVYIKYFWIACFISSIIRYLLIFEKKSQTSITTLVYLLNVVTSYERTF